MIPMHFSDSMKKSHSDYTRPRVQVWEMLASVLHLSNLEFEEVDHEQGAIASIADREVKQGSECACVPGTASAHKEKRAV